MKLCICNFHVRSSVCPWTHFCPELALLNHSPFCDQNLLYENALVRVIALVFHMSIPCEKTFMLVPSSRSSVKVKVRYQDHSFRKNCNCRGISISQTQAVFLPFLITIGYRLIQRTGGQNLFI